MSSSLASLASSIVISGFMSRLTLGSNSCQSQSSRCGGTLTEEIIRLWGSTRNKGRILRWPGFDRSARENEDTVLYCVGAGEQATLLAKHAAQFLGHICLAVTRGVVSKTVDGLEKFMPLLVPDIPEVAPSMSAERECAPRNIFAIVVVYRRCRDAFILRGLRISPL